MKKRLPKSICKYIRKEKARIRREVLELKEQERLIQELYQKAIPRPPLQTPSVSGASKARCFSNTGDSKN